MEQFNEIEYQVGQQQQTPTKRSENLLIVLKAPCKAGTQTK